MIIAKRLNVWPVLAAVLAALMLAGCGSGSTIDEVQNGPGFSIPWPDDTPNRTASDDTVQLLGNEYELLGGDAVENGTVVDMTGGGDLP